MIKGAQTEAEIRLEWCTVVDGLT